MMDLYAAACKAASFQGRVARLLGGMLSSGKLPQSMIFTGPEGSGKELVALWLAAGLNCEAPGHGAKERCPACEKVSTLEHADLHIVFPLPSGPPEKTLPLVVESRRGDFLAEGEFAGRARSIGIGQIRGVIEEVSKHPFEGRHSVIILFESHLATTEAQNAFLKLLEEPPRAAVLILVTEFPDRLLSTIRSRCQEIRFDLVVEEDVAAFLQAFYSVENKEAARLSSLAAGNLRRAVRLLDRRFLGIRQDAATALKLVLEGRARQMPAEAESLAREYTREETAVLLGEVVSLLRGAMMVVEAAAGGDGDSAAGGLEESLRAELGEEALAAARRRDIPSDIWKVETASRNLARNVDIELTLVQLLLDLAGKWY